MLPPFPDDLPTAPLDSISLFALEDVSSPSAESLKLFESCRDIGFFYLECTGSQLGERILREKEELHALQQQWYALPHAIKDEYGQDKVDPFFSYRWSPCQDGVKDVWDRPGRREMYSLRVDDVIGIRPQLPRHEIIAAAEPLLRSFATHCRRVVQLLLSHLEVQLMLNPGTLLALHREDQPRGDFIALQHRAAEPANEATVKNGEHTDFGTLTMLFNWLGGLQIRDQSQGTKENAPWVYVRPVEGACIVNVADSLSKFTNGILKTNIHRVAQAPATQAALPRYSLVYFSHPNESALLSPVKGGLVDVSIKDEQSPEEAITAEDWYIRRSLGDLRGIYTKGGIELRENFDSVRTAKHFAGPIATSVR